MANQSNKTILVTGAAGHQGGAVFQHLRRKFPLRLLVRDPGKREVSALSGPGVELAEGDLEAVASLKRVDQLLNGRLEWPLRPDTRLVALAFEHSGKWLGRTFELAGDELSMAQVARP